MLMVNKEGNCFREVNTQSKVEELRQKGFTEVKEEKPAAKGRPTQVKEKTDDGSVTVTV